MADLTILSDQTDFSGATPGIIYLPILRPSLLKAADLLTDAAQSGDAVFAIKKNGSTISGLSAVTIAGGAKIGSVSNLSVALARGDEITVDVVSGSVSAPVTLNLNVYDDANVLPGIDSPPLAPAGVDDEFESTSINSAWTQQTGGTAPTVEAHGAAKSWLLLKFGAANGFLQLNKNFSPGSANFSLTAKFSVSFTTSGQIFAFWVHGSGSGSTVTYTRISVGANSSGGVTGGIAIIARSFAENFSSNPSHGSTVVVAPNSFGTIYLHLQRTSGAYSYWYSFDGVTWYVIATGATDMAATVTEILLSFEQGGATTKHHVAVDWVRRDFLTLA